MRKKKETAQAAEEVAKLSAILLSLVEQVYNAGHTAGFARGKREAFDEVGAILAKGYIPQVASGKPVKK